MSEFKAGFIGCGNMGGTLASVCARAIGGANVAVCDKDTAKTDAMSANYGAVPTDIRALAAKCEYVFLGVKPQFMQGMLAGISDVINARQDCTVVTMAASLEIKTIREFLGGWKGRIIRIMPNIPARVGEGMILVAAGEGVSSGDVAEFEKLLAGVGRFEELPERLIDAGSAVSGCGPAYAYMFIEALADAGVECGLPRDKAQLLAAQTLVGAGKCVIEYGNPASLKDAVCSPGGTTIAGVHALEDKGMRAAAMAAVVAAYKRTLELK